MFIKDTEISVNWILQASAANRVYSDFDVIVIKPDGSSSYYNAAILEEDFISPTVDTKGAATYKITPDAVGVWVVVLTLGSSDDSTIYYEYFIRVSEPDTEICQTVYM